MEKIAKAYYLIVRGDLSGLLLPKVAENKELGKVFDDLFDADGAEIYLRPAGDHVSNFYTVLESAKRRN